MIKGEEDGYYRDTVAELVEERSAAKKKMVMEEKKKERDKPTNKFRRDQRENDDELEVSKKDFSQEYDGNGETQGTTGGAPDFFLKLFSPPGI